MKVEIFPHQRIGEMARTYGKEKRSILLLNLLSRENIIALTMAFMLGRASYVGGFLPVGVSAFAAATGLGISRFLTAVFILGGMATNRAGEQIYAAAAAMLIFSVISSSFNKSGSKTVLKYSVTALASVLIPSFILAYLNGFLLYDVLKAVLDSLIAFLLVFIFRNAALLLDETRRKQPLSSEESISVAVVAALALSGLSSISVAGVSLRNVISILAILLFSFKCGPGVGAATGVTIGLMVSISSQAAPIVIGSYAFCGLLAGIFRALGKPGSSLGFVLGNVVLTLYLSGSVEAVVYLKEIAAAIIIFIIIPQKLMDILVGSLRNGEGTVPGGRDYGLRIREITVDKLNKFARTFKELSKTFSEISQTRVVANKQDISVLFDRVADNVCRDCSMCLHCWDRNFYNTYQVMFKIVERLDSKGRIEEGDIPEYFLERCERINDFVREVNNIYELFRMDIVWKNKIMESRELVSQQLDGLSKVVANLAAEIDTDVNFKSDIEDRLQIMLKKAGIHASEVMVFENKFGKYEVRIFHKGCGGQRKCISVAEKLASEVIGRKMSKEVNECLKNDKSGMCVLKLVEEEVYRVTTGVATIPKYNSTVSGDNHTFMNTGHGKYIVAVSDGMGSGHKASVDSRAAISLLEQFLESGFDKDTTIKLINSVLVLKSSDDSFTTIDLSIIDLYSGEVEFVKIGAAPTYIKKEDRVETVKTVSLPAGIMSSIETELVHRKVSSGDFIIMVTDGVRDLFDKCEDENQRLKNVIESIDSINPQEFADLIMARAYDRCGGKPEDDMTVVVAKVWKRVRS